MDICKSSKLIRKWLTMALHNMSAEIVENFCWGQGNLFIGDNIEQLSWIFSKIMFECAMHYIYQQSSVDGKCARTRMGKKGTVPYVLDGRFLHCRFWLVQISPDPWILSLSLSSLYSVSSIFNDMCESCIFGDHCPFLNKCWWKKKFFVQSFFKVKV